MDNNKTLQVHAFGLQILETLNPYDPLGLQILKTLITYNLHMLGHTNMSTNSDISYVLLG